jgi:hypothetical protein
MPAPAGDEPYELPILTSPIKRSTMYGAAIGLLLGVISLMFRDVGEIEGVIVWRNFVVGGAAVGFVVGSFLRLILYWKSSEQSKADSKS